MKKLPIITIILSVLTFLVGCQNSDLALKEKCSKYVEIAESRYEGVGFKGTFYSRTKDTCVSVYLGELTDYSFYDELVGQFLHSGVSPTKLNEIEKSLDLIGEIK
ncbi:MAG: hypothetical protein AB1465_05915 [Patescibacteria group bacterium]